MAKVSSFSPEKIVDVNPDRLLMTFPLNSILAVMKRKTAIPTSGIRIRKSSITESLFLINVHHLFLYRLERCKKKKTIRNWGRQMKVVAQPISSPHFFFFLFVKKKQGAGSIRRICGRLTTERERGWGRGFELRRIECQSK